MAHVTKMSSDNHQEDSGHDIHDRQHDNETCQYDPPPLTEDSLISKTDPFLQFKAWEDEGKRSDFTFLSTATKDGIPSCRFVGFTFDMKQGIKFYTNEYSTKAREFTENPHACAIFYWPNEQRQVIVKGTVEKLSKEEGIAMYEGIINYTSRECQITLHVGNQDEPLSGYEELQARRKEIVEKYKDVEHLPVPPAWHCYALVPTSFQFYQGHDSWLADRLVYTKQSDDTWTLQRLNP